VREEIKSTLNSGNACCYSVQNHCKYLKIKTYKITILPVVLYECET